MVVRTILLINEEGEQLWLEEKNNGSLWQGDKEIFTSETEAGIKGVHPHRDIVRPEYYQHSCSHRDFQLFRI